MRICHYQTTTGAKPSCLKMFGIGVYFVATVISFLFVTFFGSALYLLVTNGDTPLSLSSPNLRHAAAASSDANVHRVRAGSTTRFRRQNLNAEDDVIMAKLDAVISNRLCATGDLTCKFEQRHMPPFVQTLRHKEIERLRQMHETTTLVITFNRRGNYFVAPLIYAFYRRFFAEVLYCGPSNNSTEMRRAISIYFEDSEFSEYFGQRFLPYQTEEPHIDGYGENNYFCFNLALQYTLNRRPDVNVEGILVLADDAIFSFWNMAFEGDRLFKLSSSYSLPFPKLVYDTETLKACDLNEKTNKCETPNPWINWPENYWKPTSNFYHELVEKAKSFGWNSVHARCLDRISKRAKGEFRVMTGYSDMFYVAKGDFNEALAMFELASKHKVFQEVAVPTIFACFNKTTVGFVDDSGDNTISNDVNRKSPWQAYNAKRLLTHPFKLSNIVKALAGDDEARQSRMLGICLYCMLAQYSKYLSLLAVL